ncbi:unnamed protein product [Caretta caretta]
MFWGEFSIRSHAFDGVERAAHAVPCTTARRESDPRRILSPGPPLGAFTFLEGRSEVSARFCFECGVARKQQAACEDGIPNV